MIRIDDSQGEGGGQVLRSSLALSLVTGIPFTIENIRAKRQRPGLLRQHLTAIEAAATIGRCFVDAKVGTGALRFEPYGILAGEHRFAVGTAGSATLVLQTILPALMLANKPSKLTLCGGTHNPLAPPFDFLQRVYLPLVNRLGPTVDAKLIRYGFYPAGGGEFQVEIEPTEKLGTLELLDRGEIRSRRARILLSKLPEHIAERERTALLKQTDWSDSEIVVETINHAHGPGNAVMLEVESEHVTEIFSGFGELGVSAENVCKNAVGEYRKYITTTAPVGEHLADQLLLPLSIAAWQGSGPSAFRFVAATEHFTTHVEILKRFLEIEIDVHDEGKSGKIVRIG